MAIRGGTRARLSLLFYPLLLSRPGRSEAPPRDLVRPHADPVFARPRRQGLDGPVLHPSGRRAARARDVVRDALDEHAPSGAGAVVPAVDLEADGRAGRQVELAAGRGAEDDHALVEEVVDRKDQGPDVAVDHAETADVVSAQQPYALRVGDRLERRRPCAHATAALVAATLMRTAGGACSVLWIVHRSTTRMKASRLSAVSAGASTVTSIAPTRCGFSAHSKPQVTVRPAGSRPCRRMYRSP